ncbi:MAG: SprT-like domain-containing protein [Solirubrobacterales bacterium]
MKRRSPSRRPPAYFAVAGVQLDEELERLRGLPVFAGGSLTKKRPELKVRRASTRPNRVGFAVPTEHRLQVTAYPGIRPGDVQETLLHELVHLHVGRAREAHTWHGRTFKSTLARAMEEAYGVRGVPTRSTLHGAYAEAIERQRSKPQLELDLA